MIQHWRVPCLNILLGQGANEREDPYWPLASPVVRHVVKEPFAETHTSSDESGSRILVQPAGKSRANPPEVVVDPFHEFRMENFGNVLVIGQQLALHQVPGGVGAGQLQLKDDVSTGAEGPLYILGDRVPHSVVGEVEGSKQIDWRSYFHSPQI